MLAAEQEASRKATREEVGTMPPCPKCGRPRVQRSDYVRCNPCGQNWLDGEDLSRDPRLSREPFLSSAYNRGTQSSKTDLDGTA